MAQHFEKLIKYGKNLAKNVENSLDQLAFDPFSGWFREPVPPLILEYGSSQTIFYFFYVFTLFVHL